MPSPAERLRLLLASGPATPRQLIEMLGVSQPTLSRLINAAGDEIVRIGAARSIQYAFHDSGRGFDDIPIYQVTAEGTLQRRGVLIPVREDGFVMRQDNGVTLYSDSLPWWLLDMRPAGYLGRAWASRHGPGLGLPANLDEWTDSHALRALIAVGHDAPGNLLLGDIARDLFINAPFPVPVTPDAYPALAESAERGDVPGTSAGGEQPKFIAYVDNRHVIVKTTSANDNPVSQRWRDLVLAEHHALQTLRDHGIKASASRIHDIAGRRFLEVERFDRVGATGRRAIHSLAALDAEFAGRAPSPWPEITAELVQANVVVDCALEHAAILYAFGVLIGNTDMHHGNLSFVAEHGRPYEPAPAYDMLPMTFMPRSGGMLRNEVTAARLHSSVGTMIWVRAAEMASDYIANLERDDRFSVQWQPCVEALHRHLEDAMSKIARLG